MEGRIRAVRVMISGEFSGQIEADRLEIVASGKVAGELIAEQLVIESGAQFNGTSKVKSDQPLPEPARDETVAAAGPKRSEKGSKTQREKPLAAEAETG